MTLTKRLSDATEGTRELDGDIQRVLFPDALIMSDSGQVGIGARPAVYEPIGARADLSGDVIAECTGVAFYTTSLDAALALAGRVLGEKEAIMLLADVLNAEGPSGFDLIGVSDVPRLYCAAILSAKATDTGVGG